MVILGIQVACLLAQVVLLAATEHNRRMAKDSALRAGVAFVMAKQSAERAEAAVGMAAWPEWSDDAR